MLHGGGRREAGRQAGDREAGRQEAGREEAGRQETGRQEGPGLRSYCTSIADPSITPRRTPSMAVLRYRVIVQRRLYNRMV